MARLSDEVIKRGSTWAYVIRVRSPATGVSKPRWVGGFRTEDKAKAARDDARVRARRLGHADPAITLRVYAHALNRADDGVAELFARAVSQPTPPAAPPRTSPNVSPTPSPERPPGMTR